VGTSGTGRSRKIGGMRSRPAVVQRTIAASGGTQRVASSPPPHAASPSSAAAAKRAPAVPPCGTPYGSKARRGAPRRGTSPVRGTLCLVLRVVAFAIVLLPFGLGVLLRDESWGAWVGAGLAMAGGLVLTFARPSARGLVLLGTMLAVLAGLAAPQLPLVLEEPAVVDLRSEDAPPGLRGPVVVTGFFRPEHTMAEFAVAEGALPRQDGPAEAVLVPLVGVEEGEVPLRETVVVARVRPGREEERGVRTLHGRARALEPEILSAFVQASGVDAPAGVQGVLVDATAEPRAPGWLLGGLVALAMMGATVCLVLAARRVGGDGERPA